MGPNFARAGRKCSGGQKLPNCSHALGSTPIVVRILRREDQSQKKAEIQGQNCDRDALVRFPTGKGRKREFLLLDVRNFKIFFDISIGKISKVELYSKTWQRVKCTPPPRVYQD